MPLLFLALLTVGMRAQSVERPPRAVLWIATADATADRLRGARALGFDTVIADDVRTVERARIVGLRTYTDQVLGRGWLHLEAAASDTLTQPGPRNPCLRQPATMAAGVARIRSRLTGIRPAFVSLADEPSATRFTNPADWCDCPLCREALAELAHARLGAAARDLFIEWPPGPEPTLEALRSLRRPGDALDALVRWGLSRETADRTFLGAIDHWASATRALAPGIPVGLLGLPPPSAFGGHDLERLLALVDVVEPYDLAGHHRLVRDLARPGTLVYHTTFAENRGPDEVAADLLRARVRGDTGVIVYQAASVMDGNGSPTAIGAALGTALGRLDSPEVRRFLESPPPTARVGIVHDMANVRLHWALDARNDGATWVRRLASHQQAHGTLEQVRPAWDRLFDDLGVRTKVLTPTTADEATLRSLRAIVLPRLATIDEDFGKRLERFVAEGGAVLADGGCGTFDGSLRRLDVPRLDRLFGLTRTAPGDAWVTAPERTVPGDYSPIERGISIQLGVAPTRTLFLDRDLRPYPSDGEAPRARRLRTRVAEFLASVGVDIPLRPWPIRDGSVLPHEAFVRSGPQGSASYALLALPGPGVVPTRVRIEWRLANGDAAASSEREAASEIDWHPGHVFILERAH